VKHTSKHPLFSVFTEELTTLQSLCSTSASWKTLTLTKTIQYHGISFAQYFLVWSAKFDF